MIHSSQLLFMADCGYPKLFVVWIGLYALIFLVMFANFYRNAYKKAHAKSKSELKNGHPEGQKGREVNGSAKQD